MTAATMSLQDKTVGQLAGMYNDLAKRLGLRTVNKFADKKTGVRRVTELLKQVPAEKKEMKLEGARPKGFNFEPAAELKPIKEGTLRAALRDACTKGATFEELQKTVAQHDIGKGKEPYDVKIRAYEGTRLLHFYVGYGLREGADGKIRLVLPR